MPRFHFLAIATIIWLALVVTAATGQTADTDYVRSMPSPEQVKTAIKGSNALDTSARQLGVLWQLQDLIHRHGSWCRLHRQLTAEEKALSASYLKAFIAIREPIDRSLPDAEQRRFYSLHARYQQDKGLRDETLARLIPEAACRGIYGVLGEPVPKFPNSEPSPNSPSTPGTGDAASLLIEAQRLRAARDYQGALRLYSRATELDPTNFAAFFGLGICSYQLNQWEGAAAALEKAAALMKTAMNSEGWTLTGSALLRAGHPDRALEALQRALNLQHSVATGSLTQDCVGQAQMVMDKRADAIAAFREAVRLDLNNFQAVRDLQLALKGQNGVSQPHDPAAAKSLCDRGIEQISDSDFVGATASLATATLLDPSNQDAYRSLGTSYSHFGDTMPRQPYCGEGRRARQDAPTVDVTFRNLP